MPRIDAVLYVGDIALESRNHARYLNSLIAESDVVMIAPSLLVPRKERGLCSQYLPLLLVEIFTEYRLRVFFLILLSISSINLQFFGGGRILILDILQQFLRGRQEIRMI